MHGWWLLIGIVLSGISLGLSVWIVQLLLEAWDARQRRRQVTEAALRYVEQRQAHAQVRAQVEAEQRRRLQAATQTGRPR